MTARISLDTSQGSFPFPSVLIIEDDQTMGDALQTTLARNGFKTVLATTGTEGLRRLLNGGQYDLLLLDVMLPEMDGWTVLSRVRATPALAHLPVIMLTAIAGERAEIEVLAAGADDYIPKPFSFDNLLARIEALLRRTALLDTNPLTKLPGNRPVEKFLDSCARDDQWFWAIAYVDIDNFKAYNDYYGFLKGDQVLRATAELIIKATSGYPHDTFAGNIGGDDFLVGFRQNIPRTDDSAVELADRVLRQIIEDFGEMARGFYSNEDVARGYIKAEGRTGSLDRHDLMTLSIAVVTNTRRVFKHPLEISTTFVSVKHKAKSMPGSVICYDHRRR
ncbi:MAG TPA: response regulator [Blastocatellia bacterium]|nr:response regulator [Blastocatellia bacterium]